MALAFLRWSPLLIALVASGSNCRGSSDQDEPKPEAQPSAKAVVLNLPGIDLTSLTDRERRDWSSQVSETLAPCPESPVNLAQCIQENRACKACLPAAKFLFKQVQAGRTKKEREDAYAARFDPKKVRALPTDGSPELGPGDATVTIVEWADFECPTCRAFYPILDKLVHRFPGQVRLVYKFYPLPIHAHGEISSRAGVAAFRQGKFWEMHHALFDNQERLEQQDIEGYAKALKLDMPKFRADIGSEDTVNHIQRDKKLADEINLEGTPTIFINGREVELTRLTEPEQDLEDWVKLDIELAGKTPSPPPPASAAPAAGTVAPSATPSAAPNASAAPSAGPTKK
jgi:protein-disulfide isomerase